MYTLYTCAIRNYIVKELEEIGIDIIDGIPKMVFRAYRPLSDTDRIIADIEDYATKRIVPLIATMLGVFGIDSHINIVSCLWQVYVSGVNRNLVIRKEYNHLHNFTGHMYFLGECALAAPDNDSVMRRALLLFLVDPLEFLRRNEWEINCLGDVNVREFLIELRGKVEDMVNMHIRCLLIEEIELVYDVNRIVVDKYMDLVLALDVKRIRGILDFCC